MNVPSAIVESRKPLFPSAVIVFSAVSTRMFAIDDFICVFGIADCVLVTVSKQTTIQNDLSYD
jgi:phosphosulfolactate phosphohydrolase-like enzyme